MKQLLLVLITIAASQAFSQTPVNSLGESMICEYDGNTYAAELDVDMLRVVNSANKLTVYFNPGSDYLNISLTENTTGLKISTTVALERFDFGAVCSASGSITLKAEGKDVKELECTVTNSVVAKADEYCI